MIIGQEWVPIDFDVSPSRYLTIKQRAKANKRGVQLDRVVIGGRLSRERHRYFCQQRLKMLRQAKPIHHHEINKIIWRQALDEIKKSN